MATFAQRQLRQRRKEGQEVIIQESAFTVEALELGGRDRDSGLYDVVRENGSRSTVRYRGLSSGQGLNLTGVIVKGQPGVFSA